MRWISGWLTLMALGASVAFCGTSAGSFCDARCECEGRCSDGEFRDCENDFDSDERHAERTNCLDFWDDYTACVASGDGCGDDDADKHCKREKDNWKDCVD